MLLYISIVHTFFFVGYSLALLRDLSMGAFIKFCYGFWVTTSYWVILTLGKRFKSKFMTMVCFLVVLDHLAIVITTELLMEIVGELPTLQMAMIVTIVTTGHFWFLSPSLRHTVFYMVIFFVNISQILLRHTDPDADDQAEHSKELLINRLVAGICLFGMWYILQARELKNFFNMREAQEVKDKAINKESQVTNVLNL